VSQDSPLAAKCLGEEKVGEFLCLALRADLSSGSKCPTGVVIFQTNPQNGTSTVTFPLPTSPASAQIGTEYGCENGSRTIPGIYRDTNSLS
jgi:hypothetical protein